MNSRPLPSSSRTDLLLRRLLRVALTYVQPPLWLWLDVICFLGPIVALRWIPPRSPLARNTCLLICIYAAGVASMATVLHLKIQLGDWRARLTPGFRFPHVAVAAAVIGVLNVAFPLLIHQSLGAAPWSIVALVFLVSFFLSFPLVRPLIGYPAGAVAAIILIRFVTIDFIAADLGGGRYQPAARWAIACCAVAFAWLLIDMARRGGKSNIMPPVTNMNFRATMTRNPRAVDMGRLQPVCDWMFDRVTRVPTCSPPLIGRLSRARRRRFITSMGVAPSFAGGGLIFVLLAGMVVRQCLANALSGDHVRPNFGEILVIYSLVIPICFTINWSCRWPHLAGESLLPDSRSEFVRQMGLALAADLLAIWMSCAAAALAGDFIFCRREFISAGAYIMAAIPLSAAGMIFTFGLTLWLARFRNAYLSAAAIFLAFGAALAGEFSLLRIFPRVNFNSAATWFVGFVVVGLILTLDAYRRWCRTEMD